MQITYKGDYALKAILYLATQHHVGIVSIHELAENLDIPTKFLEQILLELKKGGFVESRRGVKGGYFLVKHPRDIKVGDVVRFIDGSIEPIACADTKKHYKGCADIYNCVFRDIWVKVARSISEIIDKVTFQDLSAKLKQTKHLSYHI